MYCAVIIPIAPGCEARAAEAAYSVEFAFQTHPGLFSDVFIIRIDNNDKLEPSKLIGHGAHLAYQQDIEWLCFLDGNDILYPYAFQNICDSVENHDAIFGLISEQLPDNRGIREQQPQIRKMGCIEDLIFNDPALTLSNSYFVRTQVAVAVGAIAQTDGEFGYRLRLWSRYRCCKVDATLSVQRPAEPAVRAATPPSTNTHRQLLDAYINFIAEQCSNAETVYIDALDLKLLQFEQQGMLDQAAAIDKLIQRYAPQRGSVAHQENKPHYDLERYTSIFSKDATIAPSTITDFQQALQLDQQGRTAQAASICKAILQQTPAHSDALHLLGLMHYKIGHPILGLEILRTALEINPRNYPLWNNRGVYELGIRRNADALDCFDRALVLEINYAPAWHGRGVALKELGYHEAAVASFDRALELDPENAETLSNRGITLRELKRYDEALASFEQASHIQPDYKFLQGNILHCRQLLCHWQGITELEARVLQAVDAGKTACTPFPFLAIASSLRQQRLCVERYVENNRPVKPSGLTEPARQAHGKIRLCYFSADFCTHAVAYLTAEMFELHDRSRFEVIACSYGQPVRDDTRLRLEHGFDRFIDAYQFSDQQVAALMRELEVDIAIDLSGHTRGSRLELFAQRIAPIQCHYLGYPGTLGAPNVDYLIADRIVVAPEHLQHYAEKIAFLPNSFMVSDRQRLIDPHHYSRSELGLPETGFVFCCFNNGYKITPQVFDIWMNILGQIENSILWLSRGNAWSIPNLHKEAEQRGIAAERIVFATHVQGIAQHLARHRAADLFLDTFNYGAHTTANDALWAGLPVLTCLGDTFAGRVGASLLSAIGLPELITHTAAEYQARAIELARQPETLQALRNKLAANRTGSALFDIPNLTGHIEEAYTRMWQRHQAGLTPEHFHLN